MNHSCSSNGKEEGDEDMGSPMTGKRTPSLKGPGVKVASERNNKALRIEHPASVPLAMFRQVAPTSVGESQFCVQVRRAKVSEAGCVSKLQFGVRDPVTDTLFFVNETGTFIKRAGPRFYPQRGFSREMQQGDLLYLIQQGGVLHFFLQREGQDIDTATFCGIESTYIPFLQSPTPGTLCWLDETVRSQAVSTLVFEPIIPWIDYRIDENGSKILEVRDPGCPEILIGCECGSDEIREHVKRSSRMKLPLHGSTQEIVQSQHDLLQCKLAQDAITFESGGKKVHQISSFGQNPQLFCEIPLFPLSNDITFCRDCQSIAQQSLVPTGEIWWIAESGGSEHCRAVGAQTLKATDVFVGFGKRAPRFIDKPPLTQNECHLWKLSTKTTPDLKTMKCSNEACQNTRKNKQMVVTKCCEKVYCQKCRETMGKCCSEKAEFQSKFPEPTIKALDLPNDQTKSDLIQTALRTCCYCQYVAKSPRICGKCGAYFCSKCEKLEQHWQKCPICSTAEIEEVGKRAGDKGGRRFLRLCNDSYRGDQAYWVRLLEGKPDVPPGRGGVVVDLGDDRTRFCLPKDAPPNAHILFASVRANEGGQLEVPRPFDLKGFCGKASEAREGTWVLMVWQGIAGLLVEKGSTFQGGDSVYLSDDGFACTKENRERYVGVAFSNPANGQLRLEVHRPVTQPMYVISLFVFIFLCSLLLKTSLE